MARMKGRPIVFRTVGMSGISIVFLWASWAKISRLRGLGLPIGNWPYVERVMDCGAGGLVGDGMAGLEAWPGRSGRK